MLLPGSRFDLNFTAIDSTGANTAPTGTPTWVLLKNGAATAVTGNATMSGSQGYVTTTIPGDAAAGDRFAIRVTAVVAGLTQEIPGPSESIADLAAIAIALRDELSEELARVDVSIGSRLAAADYTAPTAPPTAVAIRAEMDSNSTKLANLDVTVSSRLASASYTAPPSIAGLCTTEKANELLDAIEDVPSAIANGAAAATAILATPANKLATNSSGHVTATNGSEGAGSLVMPLVTEAANRVSSLPLQLFTSEAMPITLTVTDREGTAVDLTGLDLVFCMARPPASVRTLAELRSFELAVISNDEWDELDVVSGLTGNELGQVTFDAPEFATKQAGPLAFSLRVDDTGEVKSRGTLVVQYAA